MTRTLEQEQPRVQAARTMTAAVYDIVMDCVGNAPVDGVERTAAPSGSVLSVAAASPRSGAGSAVITVPAAAPTHPTGEGR